MGSLSRVDFNLSCQTETPDGRAPTFTLLSCVVLIHLLFLQTFLKGLSGTEDIQRDKAVSDLRLLESLPVIESNE